MDKRKVKRKEKRGKLSAKVYGKPFLFVFGAFIATIFIGSIFMDFVHMGRVQVSWLVSIYNFFSSISHCCGATYDRAFQTLSGTLGILVTTFSFILNMGINIANRQEGKVFGIPRIDLENPDQTEAFRFLRKAAYVFPVLMVICINLELCITGYFILCLNYMVLIADYSHFNQSYKKEKYYNKVIDVLFQYAENDRFDQIGGRLGYQTMIEDIRKGIEKEEGWKSAECLYRELIKRLQAVDAEKGYFLVYYLFQGLFLAEKEKDSAGLFKWIKIYIEEMTSAIDSGRDRKKDGLILWGMVSAWFMDWTDDSISGFLEWFVDFPGRSAYKKLNDRFEGIEESLQLQVGVVLVSVEYWMQCKGSYGIQYGESLLLLWKYGKAILEEEEYLQGIVFLYEMVQACNQDGLRQCIGYLREDAKKDRQKSLVCHLIHYRHI